MNLLGPKATEHAAKELDLIEDKNNPVECFYITNFIHEFAMTEFEEDEWINSNEDPETINRYINEVSLPKGVHLVGLKKGIDHKVGIVNFGSLSHLD